MTQDPRTRWHDAEPDDEAGAEFFRPRPGEARRAATCPSPVLLQALRAGVLPTNLESHVARHVERCVVCRALGDALDGEAIEGLTPEERDRILQRVHGQMGAGHGFFRRRAWQLSATAAVLGLVAAASVLVWRERRAPADPVPAAAQRAAPAPGPAPPLRFDLPPMRLPAAASPPRPGSTESPERTELARALEPSRTNNFTEVARRLAAFVRRHPQNAAGHFYLGISNLFLYRDADAVTALEAAERLAKNDTYLLHETAWYLALAYRRTGQVEQARARLDALCRSGSTRTARACAGIPEVAIRHRLSGGVTARDGTPLSGAHVGEYVGRMGVGVTTSFSATTDVGGRYSVSGPPDRAAPNMTVRASRAGYFSAFKQIPVSEDMLADFVLDPWVQISVGEVVRATVKADEPACYYPGEPCRRFALTVPASGTLEVSVTSANRADFDLHVETPTGEVFGPLMQAPLHLALPAAAASTFEIRVLRYGGGSAEFELTTRVR